APTPATAPLPVNFARCRSPAPDPNSPISSYRLSFGDGSSDLTGSWPRSWPVSHTYMSGTFTARLTVTDTAGLASSDTKVISIAPAPPVAVLTAAPTTGTAPLA